MPLSKSDFILATSCSKKLVYKKAGYPTANDTNEYLEMLAKGGYVVGLYAQLMYPEGVEVGGGSLEESAIETKRLLEENEEITLFEASFATAGKVVRTDILQKKGDELHIIEVKSKSLDSNEDPGRAKKELKEYIEDLAYQTVVVKEAFPNHRVTSSLLLPDKAKRATIDGLAGWFEIVEDDSSKDEIEELPAQNKPTFRKPVVRFKYKDHQDREVKISELREDNLLTLRNCDEEIQVLLDEIRKRSEQYLEILRNGIKEEDYSINKKCRDCEFRVEKDKDQNGFVECWGKLADPDPNIFDLYYGGSIDLRKEGCYQDDLIKEGKTAFECFDPERFKKKNGEYGSRGERQLLQYQNMLSETEFVSEALKQELDKLVYPLHFIDFETYISALPHHIGMRPYEKITFQWSCHTIPAPGADLVHREFLNDEYSFPNFRFAESLMDYIGDTGTPLMWSAFENTTLKEVLAQMDVFGYENELLKTWLTDITSEKKPYRPGRFVDMNDMCLKHYFHPDMKGKTSIKKVLPAIWNNNPGLHDDPWFSDFKPDYESGLNPYDSLVKMMTDLEKEEVVQDGTGAMRAYHDMMFGASSSDPDKRNLIKQSLLNYCKLDTLAMVIIWKYWSNR